GGSTTTATTGTQPSLSDDGQHVVFINFAPASASPLYAVPLSADVLRYETATAQVTPVGTPNGHAIVIDGTAYTATTQSYGTAVVPVVSGDGSTVVFNSSATTLTAGD